MRKELREFYKEWKACTRCPLGQRAHYHVVGEGKLPANILIIGEAPGTSEDMIGSPFVGPAGFMLRQVLTMSGMTKRNVYITNVLACKPCDKKYGPIRKPWLEEMDACRPRLQTIIQLSKAEKIVFLGLTAHLRSVDYALKTLPGVKCQMFIHPAAVLRKGGNKEEWQNAVYKWISS